VWIQLRNLMVAEAEVVSPTEGSIWATGNARLPGTAGVPSPGHASKDSPGTWENLLVPSCKIGGGSPGSKEPGLGRYGCSGRRSK